MNRRGSFWLAAGWLLVICSAIAGELPVRFFRIEAAKFEQSVKDFIGERNAPTDSFAEQMRFFFESAGVDLRPPAQMFYNSRLGKLMLRAAVQDLDKAERLVQAVNAPGAQLAIETKLVEFSDPLDTLDLRNIAIGGFESGTNALRGILTPSRYRKLIKWLEAQKGVEIITAPRVTTSSGRPTQIKLTDAHTTIAPDNPTMVWDSIESRPALDVIPSVRADAVSIDLMLTQTMREAIPRVRYFDSGPPRPLTPLPIREYLGQTTAAPVNPVGGSVPTMTYRLRQAQSKACVWDGQTVVLALPEQRLFENSTLKVKRSGKTCFVLVTPVLIDAAGNRVHEEADLPFAEENVPK